MKDGICTKCQAENVHIAPANRTQVVVPRKSTFSTGAFVAEYFCGDCGFVEFYVDAKEDLTKATGDWPKINVVR